MVVVPENVLAESGLNLKFILKEIKLNELLAQWPASCAEQGVEYALFGGTAINKAYLRQPRFSEDADMLLYGTTMKKADALARSLKGFKASEPQRIFREMYRWTLDYAFDEQGVKDTLQLDLNLNLKHAKTPPESNEMTSFLSKYGFVVFTPRVKVLPVETLAAMKMLAILDRSAGKDYYDLYNLLSQYKTQKSRLFNEAHKHASLLFDFTHLKETFLQDVLTSIKNADEKQLAACDAYIIKQHRPDWTALKKDLTRLIKTLY